MNFGTLVYIKPLQRNGIVVETETRRTGHPRYYVQWAYQDLEKQFGKWCRGCDLQVVYISHFGEGDTADKIIKAIKDTPLSSIIYGREEPDVLLVTEKTYNKIKGEGDLK